MLETIHGGSCAGLARPPRLPMSVLKEVALDVVACDPHPRRAAARLARTCRAWLVALYGQVLLPDLVLRGEAALRHFCFSITRNVLGLGSLVARHTHTLSVLQDAHGGAPEALFDGVARTRRFGLETAELLRMALRRCSALRRLRIQCEPLALDLRDGAGGLIASRAALHELVCLQSPWAGDAIDAVWRAGTPHAPWRALSHIQLHGPRSRLSVRTADALAELPALTHLALIMPSFVGAHGTRSAEPVLAAIVERLPHLAQLLIVGHDEEHWVGATRHLRAALERLHVRCPTQRLELTLVTAQVPRDESDPMQRAHPGQYSDWMLRRALHDEHWHFGPATDDMPYVVETWTVPYAPPTAPSDTALAPPPDEEMMEANMLADELWFDAQEAVALASPGASPPSPEVWGIDNLA